MEESSVFVLNSDMFPLSGISEMVFGISVLFSEVLVKVPGAPVLISGGSGVNVPIPGVSVVSGVLGGPEGIVLIIVDIKGVVVGIRVEVSGHEQVAENYSI